MLRFGTIHSHGNLPAYASSTDNGRPISGPLAGRVIDRSAIPVGAIVVGSLVILGGAVIALLSGDDSSTDSTIDTTIDTNNGTN